METKKNLIRSYVILIRNNSDLFPYTSFCELPEVFCLFVCLFVCLFLWWDIEAEDRSMSLKVLIIFLMYVVHIPSQLLAGLLILNLVLFHYFKSCLLRISLSRCCLVDSLLVT